MTPFLYLILLVLNCTVYGLSPYAPSAVGTSASGANKNDRGVYTCDPAGNRLGNSAPDYEQAVSVGFVTKPTSIQQGSEQPAIIRYGIAESRYLRVHADGRKTLYLRGYGVSPMVSR